VQPGIFPFGVITGVAMVASGIEPLAAMTMSLAVFAGASMVASAQLLASGSPALLVILATLFINLRFMMYSASLRQHFAHAPLHMRLLAAYLTADNAYGLLLGKEGDESAKLDYFLGAGALIWIAWQAAVAAGILVGAGLPASWRLEFAAPLAFVAMSVPLLRDRAMVGAAMAAGITVIAAQGLPRRHGLAAAALTGHAVGLLLERRRGMSRIA
jgi:predicted branched-subunit amino acid permease